MHYGNGRPANNGDKVLWVSPYSGVPRIGILYDAEAGNSDCNGHLAEIPGDAHTMPDLKECLHLDDALELLELGKAAHAAGLSVESIQALPSAEEGEDTAG